MHEKDYDTILKAACTLKDNSNVDGLLFKYHHFYGTFNYVGDTRRWYAHEIRMIKNNKAIKSYRDAQGFRKNEKRLQVKKIDAHIYHYGWVRTPKAQVEKLKNFYTYWNGGHQVTLEQDMYDYMSNADSLALFTQTHPKVMEARIAD